MPLVLRDILNRLIANAEALNRLSIAAGDGPLDADRLAHLQELFDELSARVGRMTEEIHGEAMRRHVEMRVTPYQRRSGLGDRRR
jgi:hypothetical protein